MNLAVVAIVAFLTGFGIGTATWLALVWWQRSRHPAPLLHRPREALKAKGEPVRQGYVSGAAGITADDVDEMSDVVIAARLASNRQREQEKHAHLLKAGQALAAERAAFGDRSVTSWLDQ